MYVVWLNIQLCNSPSVFFALALNQGPTILRYVTGENRLFAFGRPDQMIDDEIDPMFVSAIIVDFHVDKYIIIYKHCLRHLHRTVMAP